MSFHKVIVSVISILATFIQTEFQSQHSSLFETHCWIMYAFYVALSIYAVVAGVTLSVHVQAAPQNRGNDNEGVLTKVAVMSGALASTLLLLIIRQVLGWVAFAFWVLFFAKTAYELVHVYAVLQVTETLKNIFLHALETLKNTYLRFMEKLKNKVRSQSKDVLPVSV
ncbi:hypothetical protein PanWU01x14_250330 [Parasponia andersonii]|uniref:Transmembrane protein n=1 Tax=Parasponia andersonii TaxID=3476 RepID=A0A2P5BCT2_PARAD|nr:hypothetical protein PanWU01x14_250330 [Parasponia andersonii]